MSMWGKLAVWFRTWLGRAGFFGGQMARVPVTTLDEVQQGPRTLSCRCCCCHFLLSCSPGDDDVCHSVELVDGSG